MKRRGVTFAAFFVEIREERTPSVDDYAPPPPQAKGLREEK
jgi:hypothetical protein